MIGRKLSFGAWLKQRRRSLDLTQQQLAEHVCCAVITLQKIEAGERRPSRQIAELLAIHLQIAPEDRAAFTRFARSPLSGSPILSQTTWQTSTHPANLPEPATRLIGRNREAEEVCSRVLDGPCRLLTLVGPPGVGKTRLAVHAAKKLANDFDDGVCWVELASLREPDQVPAVIAQTLRVSETAGQTPDQRLKAYLHERHLLLVLDNFEQVAGAASFVATLLEACPWLSILATSRAPLRIRAERQYRVRPLASPPADQTAPDPQALLAFPAVELFVDRGRASAPEFNLTEENVDAVIALCGRLDGLPLAIELLAPRVAVLPAGELLQRLGHDLLLHGDGARDMSPRHQTLGDAIEWSYALLPPPAQDLLRRCSVFAGGWPLPAAEALMDGEGDNTLAALTPLVEGNLVVREAQAGDVRFSLLETIREFALERLAQCGEEGAVRKQHAESYLALAEEANRHLRTAEQGTWLQCLESERGNLQAALAWFFEGGGAAGGVRLAAALVWFWLMRSRLGEGWEWLTQAVAHRGEVEAELPAAVAKALLGSGAIAWQRGDLVTARGLIEESVRCLRACGPAERGELAWALSGLGMVASFQVDTEAAQAASDESLRQAEACGDPWLVGLALNPVAETCMLRHDYATARVLLERSRGLFQSIGDKWALAVPLLNGGYMDALLGDTVAARAQLEEAIGLCRELGEMDTCSRALAVLAGVAQQEGDLPEATELYRESLDLLQRMGLEEGCAETLYHLARLTEAQGHDQLAAKLYSDCLALYERYGNRAGIERCRARMAG